MVFWMVLLVILVLPVRLRFNLNNKDGLMLSIRISYAWGAVSYINNRGVDSDSFTICIFGIGIYRNSATDIEDEHEKTEKSGAGKNFSEKMLYYRYVVCFINKVYRTLIAKNFTGRIRAGFGDPAYTGMLCGMVSCVAGRKPNSVVFQPDFSGAALEFDLRFDGVFIPAVVIILFVSVLAVYLKREVFSRIYVRGGRKNGFKGEPEGDF